MKKKLTNNLGMKLLSLGLATIIWLLIVNVEDPLKTDKISGITVQVLNKDVIESLNKVYEVTEGGEVDVIVKGKQSIVNSLKAEDITVTADMKDLSITNSISLNVECQKLTNAGGTIELGSVKNMRVVLEDVKKATFKVEIAMTGDTEKGYYTSTELMKTKPTFVEVSAAESVFAKIKTVKVTVDVKNRSEDFNIALTPKAYDENGKVIESQNLIFGSDLINVAVNVLPVKKIPVEVTLQGTPQAGYQVTEHVYEPKEIQIAAANNLLAAQTKLSISINVNGLNVSKEESINLKDYLPEGVYIADTNSELVSKVTIEKLEEKEITFTTSNIDVKLPTTDANVSFLEPGTSYRVRVSALKGVLDGLTIRDLHPYIDMTGLSYGSHNVAIQFNSDYPVTIVGSGDVAFQLVDPKEATPSPTPEDKPTSGQGIASASPGPTSTPMPSPTETKKSE